MAAGVLERGFGRFICGTLDFSAALGVLWMWVRAASYLVPFS